MTTPKLESDTPRWRTEPERLAPGAGRPAVAAALAWLEALSERQAWPARARIALLLCADEALANVGTHARTSTGEAAHMWLACGASTGGIALCIEDDGLAFDPTAQTSPTLAATLDDALPGGHGLRLMRHYLQRLCYRREGERNRLWLEVASD